MAPMSKGIRITTGAEFATRDAPPNPVQLDRVEPLARAAFPLAERVEAEPWLGRRPCFPDMLPVIGQAAGKKGFWMNFGHHHLGFTLGPVTGRLLAEIAVARARQFGRMHESLHRAREAAKGNQRLPVAVWFETDPAVLEVERSTRILGMHSPLVAMLGEILQRGVAQGRFRPGVDPVRLYTTIASLGFFYLSNRYTLSAIFRRDLADPRELEAWGRHIVEVVLAYLRPQAA